MASDLDLSPLILRPKSDGSAQVIIIIINKVLIKVTLNKVIAGALAVISLPRAQINLRRASKVGRLCERKTHLSAVGSSISVGSVTL